MTFVMIHGGASTGGYWDRLVPFLEGPVIAVDLPGRRDRPGDLVTLTLTEAVEAVTADVLDGAEDDVVLVAHSSGGLVVPGVVASLPPGRVRAIVLNAASVPPEGGCGLDCMKPRHRDLTVAALDAHGGLGGGLLVPKPERESFARSLGDDLDDELLDFASDPSRAVVDAYGPYLGEVRWSQVGDVPVTYVVNTLDRALSPDLQREMAARLPRPPQIVEVETGHLAAITRPADLAAILRSAAAQA